MCWKTVMTLACACIVLVSATHASPARRALSELAARRRSMTDKNFMRFGRSDPLSTTRMLMMNARAGVHRGADDRKPDEQHLRFGRARPESILRFGRGGSAQGSVPSFLRESSQGSLHRQEEKHYPDYPEMSHNFFEEELLPEAQKRRYQNIDFLRFGRGNANILRFGRSPPLEETDHDLGLMDFPLGEDGIENDKMLYDEDFLRYGRSGNSESALEIDLPAGSGRKRRDTGA